MMRCSGVICVIFFAQFLFECARGESSGYFLKAAKNVPRIGRSSNSKNANIDEMGKFFMKASKSVPRIGRRNENQAFEDGPIIDHTEKRAHYPLWAEIADRFEYEPELFSNPEFMMHLEQEMGDDASSSLDWEKERVKRSSVHPKFRYLM